MDNEKIIADITEKWTARKEHLTNLFRNREKSAVKEPMDETLDAFLTFLFVMNGKKRPPDKEILQNGLKDLDYKPINLDERLSFILKKPSQYHSFVQLNELYHELLKLYAKTKIRKHKK
ncbi:YpoC family protein [Bacillus sp. 1P02SD]|uniref:YpoC family protein n=1 Tax=Bacillus sp. 1P02SD TaxID=3132264 RepID=UPI0039A375C0